MEFMKFDGTQKIRLINPEGFLPSYLTMTKEKYEEYRGECMKNKCIICLHQNGSKNVSDTK